MRRDHTLRPARRPARIENHRAPVARDAWYRGTPFRTFPLEGGAPSPPGLWGEEIFNAVKPYAALLRERSNPRRELGVSDHDRRLRVVDDVGELACRMRHAERYGDAAGPPNSPLNGDMRAARLHEKRDARFAEVGGIAEQFGCDARGVLEKVGTRPRAVGLDERAANEILVGASDERNAFRHCHPAPISYAYEYAYGWVTPARLGCSRARNSQRRVVE